MAAKPLGRSDSPTIAEPMNAIWEKVSGVTNAEVFDPKNTRSRPTKLSAVALRIFTVLDEHTKRNRGCSTKNTVFASTVPLKCPLLDYFKRFHTYGCPCPEDLDTMLIVTLIYMDRAISNISEKENERFITKLSICRIFATAFRLASKCYTEAYFNNRYIAGVAGISTAELNKLEVEFLFIIGCQCYVTEETFYTYRDQLLGTVPSTGVIRGSSAVTEPLDLAVRFCALLNYLIKNSKDTRPLVTVFTLKNAAPLSLEDYMKRFQKYLAINQEMFERVLIIALFYIDYARKLFKIKHGGKLLTERSIHRVFATAILLSYKNVSNPGGQLDYTHISHLAGISEADMRRLETNFLDLLDGNSVILEEDLSRYAELSIFAPSPVSADTVASKTQEKVTADGKEDDNTEDLISEEYSADSQSSSSSSSPTEDPNDYPA